jgi:hypothetical protein
MKRYALTYLDRLGCLGVRELWELTDDEAVVKMMFHAKKDGWKWYAVTEIPQ